MKRIFKQLTSLLVAFIVSMTSIGFSDWLTPGSRNTSEAIQNNLKSDYATIKVHSIKEAGTSISTRYWKPKSVNVDTSKIVPNLDSSGKQVYEKYPADRYKYLWNTWDGDERPQYKDGNSLISEHDNNAGEEQFKSVTFDVTEWQSASSIDDYGVVWDCSVSGRSDRFRFACDEGNSLSGHSQKYEVGDIRQTAKKINEETIESGDKITINTYYQRTVVSNVGDKVYGQKKVSIVYVDYKVWYYYVNFEQIKVETTIEKNGSSVVEDLTENNIRCNIGSKISPVDIGIADYTQYGFFADVNETEFFDFTKPITEDTDIYIRYLANDTPNESLGLTNVMNGKTIMNLYDVFSGGSGDANSFNVAKDASYFVKSKSVFLGQTIIENNQTVNLTYQNSQVAIDSQIDGNITSSDAGIHKTSLDAWINESYDNTGFIGDNKRSINVILSGDLTVKGTLQVGAMIGASSEQIYSMIIGYYASLDLYGHDLIVDGGTLNALGIIKDSIGTGKIIVKNGGKILSTVTISDGIGGRNAALGLTKRQSPFSEYKFSYLRVPVEVHQGSSFVGYFKLYFSDFGIVNAQIPIISTNGLFSWANSSYSDENYVLYDYEVVDALATNDNSTINKQMYFQRNAFYFYADINQSGTYEYSGKLNYSSSDFDFTVNFARIDFPISVFFDLNVMSGYQLNVYSKMTFYPGSSLTAQPGSSINFKVLGNQTYSEMGATVAGMGVILPKETRYVVGSLFSHYDNCGIGRGSYSQSTFRKYIKTNNINIQGDITLDGSIDTSKGYYTFAGRMNFSKEALSVLKVNTNKIKTYDMKAEITSTFLYSKDYHGGMNDEYVTVGNYNVMPLVSNGIAYIIDPEHDLQGAFDFNSGLFSTTSSSYVLLTDNDMFEEGSSGSNQSSPIDRSITVTEISKKYTSRKIVELTNGNQYAYYRGLFVPLLKTVTENEISSLSQINVNLRKFMSNKDTKAATRDFTKYTKGSDGKYSSSTESVYYGGFYDDLYINWDSNTWNQYEFKGYTRKSGGDIYYTY